MNTLTPDQIREQQRETWNKFSPGWKKWDTFTMDFLRPMGDAMIEELQLRDSDQVLDVAAGTGEPGLTIARRVPHGKVVSTDLAEGMLAIARETAQRLNLSNFQATLADACALPFADGVFDAVSCRMGFMFFPDTSVAAREMARVLKPGGHIAASVWAGQEKNPWITTIMGVITKTLQLPPPPPGAPGMFRCARPGATAELFLAAGFRDVREREVAGQVVYDDPDFYWTNMLEIAAPVVSALSKTDDTTREKIKAEVFHSLRENAAAHGGRVVFNFGSTIISGTK
jgi:ubiquinone/menaquinone biosynthesis C-methylase UbiE